MSRALLRPGEIAWPPRPDEIFGRAAPFVLEVGFGNGLFLEEMARAHPEWNLLGVEVAPASVTRGYRRILSEGLPHVRVMRCHGVFAVRELAPPGGLRRVFVNFPDPWPREKHQPRRLMQQPFLRMLSTRLQDGGDLLFTSDHEEYFRFAVAEGRATGLYDVVETDPPAEMLRTKYAQRWLGMRKRIFHAVFAKRAEDDQPHPPRLEVTSMQHIRLEGSLEQVGAFEKAHHPFRGGQVIVKTCYQTRDGRALIFLCIVDEADLRQEVLVEARPSASGIFVALMGFGAPVVTRGVKEAVRACAGWLRAEGLELIEEAL